MSPSGQDYGKSRRPKLLGAVTEEIGAGFQTMAEGRAQDGKDRRRKLRSEMINIRASPSRVQECLVGWTLTKQG